MRTLRKQLKATYTIWLRELTKFYRERTQFASTMVTPVLWLIVFGGGMGINLRTGAINTSYNAFIFPGIIGMTLLFTSMRSGISIIWDREFGFLKEILVAPISWTSIVMGKALGGGTNAMIQGTILLLLSVFVGISLTPLQIVLVLPLMLLISLGFDGFGLSIASVIESYEGFQTIMSFVIMPTFFLSGALFPLTNAPRWLQIVSDLDPMTYGVDAMRQVILRGGQFPMGLDLCIMIAFTVIMLVFTSYRFTIKN
ncbi:ABC transporter permease [Methanosphaerula palustris]|uniref:Daunorubicin resistance ABC transporter, inner membrane subunit B n=1 Tax=Methanosphaerula palustris (strain ATCC BAA-1556 / DSM 19958 / E1-9c) TaxID=521011 RepID=B8GH64_METPE|nr:ABC transporter permease [Methanosphaerula palustris]ACL16469.1 daunorubicin resistance ABC transporter, inner membrane subunit B [Methanosphaerula palustris E1-9c]